jgi:hypothetical protein
VPRRILAAYVRCAVRPEPPAKPSSSALSLLVERQLLTERQALDGMLKHCASLSEPCHQPMVEVGRARVQLDDDAQDLTKCLVERLELVRIPWVAGVTR